MNKIFLMSLALLSLACQANAEQKSVLQEVEGVWNGIAIQDNNSKWPIKVTISSDDYWIDYPSLNCGGMMELVKENSDSLVFKEVLTYGMENCYNNGKTVLIKSKDDKLRYYWYFENNGKKAAAGELSRESASAKKSRQHRFSCCELSEDTDTDNNP